MKSKLRNGGFLLALFGALVFLLGQFGLAAWMPPWLADTVGGAITILWLLGIVSDTNGKGIWNFTGVPFRLRLEDPTVLKALLAWFFTLLANLNNLFKFLPVSADVNAMYMMALVVSQAGGWIHSFDQIVNPKSDAAAISSVGDIAAGSAPSNT